MAPPTVMLPGDTTTPYHPSALRLLSTLSIRAIETVSGATTRLPLTTLICEQKRKHMNFPQDYIPEAYSWTTLLTWLSASFPWTDIDLANGTDICTVQFVPVSPMKRIENHADWVAVLTEVVEHQIGVAPHIDLIVAVHPRGRDDEYLGRMYGRLHGVVEDEGEFTESDVEDEDEDEKGLKYEIDVEHIAQPVSPNRVFKFASGGDAAAAQGKKPAKASSFKGLPSLGFAFGSEFKFPKFGAASMSEPAAVADPAVSEGVATEFGAAVANADVSSVVDTKKLPSEFAQLDLTEEMDDKELLRRVGTMTLGESAYSSDGTRDTDDGYDSDSDYEHIDAGAEYGGSDDEDSVFAEFFPKDPSEYETINWDEVEDEIRAISDKSTGDVSDLVKVLGPAPKGATKPGSNEASSTAVAKATATDDKEAKAKAAAAAAAARVAAAKKAKRAAEAAAAKGKAPVKGKTAGASSSKAAAKKPAAKAPVARVPLSKQTAAAKKPPVASGAAARKAGSGFKSIAAKPSDEMEDSMPDVSLIEQADETQVETQAEQDDDYGAVDLSVIDTYVGSFNAGTASEAEWDDCLDFFKINPAEFARQEALRGKSGDSSNRKRTPIKKLPGCSVGLFDYQLMGVLNLLKLTLKGVPGGILADEQGLGKSIEMLGLIALAYNLRRSKAEVLAAWRTPGKKSPHNAKGSGAKTCGADDRYGIRCYCYSEMTQKLADALPNGPCVIVAPARSAAQMAAETKAKLDTRLTFKLRLKQDNMAGLKDEELKADDLKALKATVTATDDGNGGVKYEYKNTAAANNYVLIVSPQNLSSLTNGSCGVDVKMPDGKSKKRDGLMPAMVLMDEFHECTHPAADGKDTNVMQWLKHLSKSTAAGSPQLLSYFVSGTPLSESPADIRQAIALFEQPGWKSMDPASREYRCTLSSFDSLIATFDELTALQSNGELVDPAAILAYRRHLSAVMHMTTVRRLGIDQFRGVNLTDIGPLRVNIVDHHAPVHMVDDLQRLTDSTCARILKQLGSTDDIAKFLRSDKAEPFLLKLRLASTFPGIARAPASEDSVDDDFTFSTSEVIAELASAHGNLTRTRYFPQIPSWSTSSPKLATIVSTIDTMLADKTKIEGEAAHSKKFCIFSPLEAESALIYGYLLLLKKQYPAKYKTALKPVWIHSGMTQSQRQAVIDSFLQVGNAPPNVFVAPMALAGTGLNFQKAKYSTITSPAFRKVDNQQAFYRIHRVGQKQQTQLQLLTARWNPADRVIQARYESKAVALDKAWIVDNAAGDEGAGEGMVDRHQQTAGGDAA